MRTRNYATVVYPESAPSDWQDILAMQYIPCFISPIHDRDFNPTGEPKKAHYHVLLTFENVKTVKQAQDVFSKIGGVGCETVQSLRGYARYLCHLDNPDKAQYSIDDVISLSGADYNATIGLPTDKYKIISDIMDFVIQNGIYSFSELLEISRDEHYDWFRLLCDNSTVVVKEYLKSKSWTDKRKVEY